MDKSREQWLKDRTTGIGGSDASVILGTNPWKSRIELWTEKTTGIVKEDDNNPNFLWGKLLEPVIANQYQEETGRVVIPYTKQIKSKEYPFMNANVDRFLHDYEDVSKNGLGVLEIKTKGAFINWEDNEIPIYYYAQIQHYLSVTERKWASFCAFDLGRKNLIIKDVERDDKFIENLIEEEKKFWNLVVNKVPPEIEKTVACEAFLKETYKKSEPVIIDISSNQVASAYAEQLHNMNIEKKNLKEIELECKTFFMNLMKNVKKVIGINYSITWKNDKDSVEFDKEKFKNDNPSLYEKYTIPKKGSKRFTFKYHGE